MLSAINWATLPQTIYFLAFPLFGACALLLFPWFALKKTRSVSANLLDLKSFGLGCVTVTACALAWTSMLTGWTTLSHGFDRFNVEPLFHASDKISPVVIAAFSVLALPLIFYSARYSVTQGSCTLKEALMGVAAGLVVTGAIAFCVWESIPRFLKVIQEALGPLLSYGGAGYADAKTGDLYPQHAAAIVAFSAALILYGAIGVLKYLRQIPMVPSLSYLLLFLVVACWTLSGLSFFLDAFRIPTALVVGLWLMLTSQLSNTDHFFHVWRAKDKDIPPSPRPFDVLACTPYDSVIAVAANGGGIQSAAWTARVLAGIEAIARQQLPDRPGIFTQVTRFISSVSGGSVGTMFFVSAFDAASKGLPPQPGALDQIVENAEASSLDPLAWGLFYPDFGKTIIPLPGLRWKDRGHALEVAFQMKDPRVEAPLASWRKGVVEGWRPATSFNATLSDTGERLLLSTADLNPETGDARKNFCELFPDEDDACDLHLSIASAARLSATFPYVTPAARADLGGPSEGQWHAVDGGYYDNYGMSTLVEWLNEGLGGTGHGIKRVLVLQIRGLPPDNASKPGTQRGWFYQAVAPLATMFNVRSCGQLSHNNVEYDLLKAYWEKLGIAVETVVFQFPSRKELDDDPPLSWHLTPKQKAALKLAWEKPSVQKACADVVDFLGKMARKSRGTATSS